MTKAKLDWNSIGTNQRERDILEAIVWPPKKGFTSVDDLLKRARERGIAQLERPEVLDLLKRLEAQHRGAFKAGRKGWPSRLEWRLEDSKGPENGVGPAAASPQVIEHPFRLRPDFSVELRLPLDISQREADRLAAFVRTLPFVEGD